MTYQQGHPPRGARESNSHVVHKLFVHALFDDGLDPPARDFVSEPPTSMPIRRKLQLCGYSVQRLEITWPRQATVPCISPLGGIWSGPE